MLLVSVGLFADAQSQYSNFDHALAGSLKTHQYDMKAYVLVILETGSATISVKPVADNLLKGHMDNAGRLLVAVEPVVAGPLKKTA